MHLIEFTVFGVPQPQGSTKAFIPKGWKRAIITSDNKKIKPWRQEIAGVAIAKMAGLSVCESAVSVDATFYFDRPKSTPKRVTEKITKPDVDKLGRGLLDALSGIVFKDDSQVVRCKLSKEFGTPSRMEVKVWLLT